MARRPPPSVTPEQAALVEALNGRMREQWTTMCAAQAALLSSVAEYAALDGPVIDNTPNVAATLIIVLGCSGATARALASQAGVIDAPGLADALTAGQLTPDHLGVLARRGVTDDNVAAAHTMDADDLAAHLRQAAKPTGHDERSARDRRKLTLRRIEGGDMIGSFRLPAADGETVRAALERHAAQQPVNPETGTFDSLSKQWADALVDLCSGRLADDADPDRATVSVVVDHHFDRGWLLDGTIIGSSVLARLLCDCRLEAVLASAPGEEPRYSMMHRAPWPAQLRALKRRQHGQCGWPGCHRQHFLHAHHLHHWSTGGRTVLANLVLLCRYHHALVHEGGWTATGHPDHLTITKPDGTRWRPPWSGLLDLAS
jgi:hypothetical protein